MPQDQGVTEAQLSQLESAGKLVPINQTPTINPAVRTNPGAPPTPQQQPANLSGSLPQVLQLQPDIERTAYGPSTPTFRLMPVGASGNPNNVAAAQSTAQQVVDETVKGSVGSLVMPTDVFAVTGSKPLTSDGGAIKVAFSPEDANTALMGPLGAGIPGVPNVDTVKTGTSGSFVSSGTVGTMSPSSVMNEWAIIAVSAITALSNPPGYTPPTGWTALQPATGSNGQGLSWQTTTLTPVTPVVGFSPSAAYAAVGVLFFTNGGTPTVAQKQSVFPIAGLTSTVSFGSTTAGNFLLVIVQYVNAGGSLTVNNLHDSQGNSFQLLGSATEATADHCTTYIYGASDIIGGADTVSITTTGSSGSGVMWVMEVSGLGIQNGIPTFRHIENVDLQYAIFGPSGSSHNPGAVPDPGATAGTTRFLREDATWDVISSFYQTVESNGTPLTQRANLNFLSPLTAVDNSGNNSSDIDISVFGASGPSHSTGAVPDPGSSAGTTRFLREDATWQVVNTAPFNQSIKVNSTVMSDDYWISINQASPLWALPLTVS